MHNAVLSVGYGSQQFQVLGRINEGLQFFCICVVLGEFGEEGFELLGILDGVGEGIFDFFLGGVVMVVHVNNENWL